MYLIKLNDKINKTAWHAADVLWLKQRKQQWKKLSTLIKQAKSLRPKDLKYYKNYFLTGELHEELDEFNYPPTVNATILMIFHPDQSEANLLSVYNEYLLVYGEVSRNSAVKFFNREIAQEDYGAGGILGGNEALYCKILFGTTNEDFAKINVAKNPSTFPGYCRCLISFLVDKHSYINNYDQYLTDFSFYTAQNTQFEFGANPTYIGQFLQVIGYYELLDPFIGGEELRHRIAHGVVNKEDNELHYQRAWVLVNKVREKLTESNLPQPLIDIWKNIQTEQGKKQVFEHFQGKYPILKQVFN